MLKDPDWRPHLVASIAVLVSPDPASFSHPLWGALDRGSWVAPQLAVTLLHSDPAFVSEAKQRIDAGCPVAVPSLSSGLLRHVATGPAGPAERSSKNLAALLRLVAMVPPEQQWAQDRERTAEVQDILRSDRDLSGDIALYWHTQLQALFAQLSRPLRHFAV
jgi:hypothetical protein